MNATKESEAGKKMCYKYTSQQWQGYKDILEDPIGHAMFGRKFRSNVLVALSQRTKRKKTKLRRKLRQGKRRRRNQRRKQIKVVIDRQGCVSYPLLCNK